MTNISIKGRARLAVEEARRHLDERSSDLPEMSIATQNAVKSIVRLFTAQHKDHGVSQLQQALRYLDKRAQRGDADANWWLNNVLCFGRLCDAVRHWTP